MIIPTNTLYKILELLDPSQLIYLILNKSVFFHGTVSEIRYNVLDRIDINDYFVQHMQSYNSHLYLDLIYVGE